MRAKSGHLNKKLYGISRKHFIAMVCIKVETKMLYNKQSACNLKGKRIKPWLIANIKARNTYLIYFFNISLLDISIKSN